MVAKNAKSDEVTNQKIQIQRLSGGNIGIQTLNMSGAALAVFLVSKVFIDDISN